VAGERAAGEHVVAEPDDQHGERREQQALTRNFRSTWAMYLKSASPDTAMTLVVITSRTIAFIGPDTFPDHPAPARTAF
jgi:hypothetical protein